MFQDHINAFAITDLVETDFGVKILMSAITHVFAPHLLGLFVKTLLDLLFARVRMVTVR